MTRGRSLAAIEADIRKVQSDIIRNEETREQLDEKLLQLQDEKLKFEAKEIIAAYKKSEKSFTEVMTFLKG